MVGCVLWYINPCGLSSAKSCLCIYIIYMICKWIVSWNFSDWFTVGEGDKLLVLTLLPTSFRAIFYFGMSFNHKWTGKTMTQRFLNKPKMKTTWNAQFWIQIILLSNKKIKACMWSKIVLATKIKMFVVE